MLYTPAADTKDKKSPNLTKTLAKLLQYESSQNIAEDILAGKDGEEILTKIAGDVERKYKIDKASRSDWEDGSKRAMDIALQVRKPKNYPFDGAANIKYPLVTVAALQFGARAYPAIVDGGRIVKAQVVGNDSGVPIKDENGDPRVDPLNGEPLWLKKPGEKRAKADRVSRHMSYQLLNEMEEWEEDTDVLLHHLPIVGCAFRKVWRSETLGRNKSEMVPAINLVVNNKCRSLDEAPAVTHEVYIYPQDIEERKLSGLWCDIDLPAPVGGGEGEDAPAVDDEDAPHLFLEQHCFIDLDNDGYREPYIVTLHKESCQVVRIVANYRMEAIKDNGKKIIRIPKDQFFVKYSFIPDPKGGFYDIGFGRLLESLGETIDTTINQMLDAGHLQNAGGGFIGTGIRLKKGGQIKVSPGRFEQIETTGKIGDQVHMHQFQGPSPVLFQLLGMMIEAAKEITAVKDILTGETNGQTQTATTTLAMIEQGLKVFTAIYKRIYRSLKDEFKLLFELNARHIDEKAYYIFNDEQEVVEKSDYDLASLDVCPQADPKMVTDMQRAARSQVYIQIANDPALGPLQDPAEALRRIYDAIGTEEPDKLFKKQQPNPAADAQLQEIQAKTAKHIAGAHKDAAVADKTTVETQMLPSKAELDAATALHKVALSKQIDGDIALAPAHAMLAAHAQDMGDAHKMADRAHAAQQNELDRAAAKEVATHKTPT
jgi:chaperonin GroES